ncbi:hypothetical protein Pth03_17570 [Planotetraspora thailandica]|uniref:Uncharacterized protein n=1 Tax=Planotetraspora thailandica TaxID=487172 RepID=A0A8J3UWR9_9ACTN|nr:hypothetical protein [Planotetraspora thailandica]GII53368.1 hypothetical protein Pth03_17570 [Planotetraspora thailandica]
MAEGREQAGRPFIRSSEATTTPMPRVRPEDQRQTPPVARGSRHGSVHGTRSGSSSGDLPVGLYATVATVAAVATVVTVGLVFLIFFSQKHAEVEQIHQAGAQVTPSAAVTGSASPASPSSPASSALPKLPRGEKRLPALPGTATTVVAPVVDRTAGIAYPRFGEPWSKADPKPYSFVQRSGVMRKGQAMIASSRLPGAAPKRLSSYSDYRYYAGKAAQWTLRSQPPGGRLVWTASQPAQNGIGWLLGYKITYVVDGKPHTSQAVVAVIGTGQAKPAMLWATVPDTDKALLPDLNALAEGVRPI